MVGRKINLLNLFTLLMFIFAAVLTIINFINSFYSFALLTLGSALILLGSLTMKNQQ